MAETCTPARHVWTPLYPGWEPHDTSVCDCGATTAEEARRAGLRTAAGLTRPPEPTRPDRWDVARGPLKCRLSCGQTIGAGEPYRRVSMHNHPCCVACAQRILREAPPDDLPVRRIAEDLRIPGVTPVMPPLTPIAPLARRMRATTAPEDDDPKMRQLPERDR